MTRKRSGRNEDGEGYDATLRQENVIYGPDIADDDIAIGDCDDLIMNAIVGRAYDTPSERIQTPLSLRTVILMSLFKIRRTI